MNICVLSWSFNARVGIDDDLWPDPWKNTTLEKQLRMDECRNCAMCWQHQLCERNKVFAGTQSSAGRSRLSFKDVAKRDHHQLELSFSDLKNYAEK